MKIGFILGCLLIFNANASALYHGLKLSLEENKKIEACGLDQQDLDAGAGYHWVTLSEVKINAKVKKIDGLLCVGSFSDELGFDLIHYRDNAGSRKAYSVKQLMERQILVDHTDLDIGIIKEGPIMSLKVTPLSLDQYSQSYLVSFRFLRNLSKLSRGRDIRQMQFRVDKEHGNDQCVLSLENKPELTFHSLGLAINLGLKIDEINLVSENSPASVLETKNFTEVDDLIND